MSVKSVLSVWLGCVLPAAAAGLAGEPKVRITEIDAAQGVLKGIVHSASQEEAQRLMIVVMIRTDLWYRHPFADSTAEIRADGAWQMRHVSRGGEREIAALLVRKDSQVPEVAGDLRDIRCLASAVLPYQAKYVARDEAAPAREAAPRLRFAGHEWSVRDSRGGPGPNTFGPRAVSADGKGNLVMRVLKDGGVWVCAEAVLESEKPLGYGEYRFQVAGEFATLDPRIVLGLFVYESDQREIDVELARWSDPKADNAQFVVQPAGADSIHRFSTGEAKALTCAFAWAPSQVKFRCWEGLQPASSKEKPIAEWVFAKLSVPAPSREKVHINLWCAAGQPPLQGKGAEVLVKGFEFIPAGGAQPTQAKPAIAVWVDEGNRVHGFVTGLAVEDAPKYGVKCFAHTDIWYIQPYEGDIHDLTAKLTFETWTRAWGQLKAELVRRDHPSEVLATATYKRGDPKPTPPAEREK